MKAVMKILSLGTVVVLVMLLSQCLLPDTNGESFNFDKVGSIDAALLNPERGWYIARETSNIAELRNFRNDNVSIVLLEANLKGYTGPITPGKLDEIRKAFEAAYSAGLSVIFRAAYDFEGEVSPEPDINTILNHIRQLEPIFAEYEHILFNVQAGFIGSWGEWHSTRFGDGLWAPAHINYQRTIANALLEAVPKSVTVALRRPEYIRNIADPQATGNARGDHAPVTRAEAFGSEKIARLAFHNDALMSDATDMDTYNAPGYPRAVELDWISQQTRYTPMVAETNKVSRYNDTRAAISFLNRTNMQSLNKEYHHNVLGKWRFSRYEGMNAFDYIGMMQGYRFVLKRHGVSVVPDYDGSLRFDFEVVNVGFGHLLREKDFEIVLKNGSETYRTVIDEDPRHWNKNEPVRRIYHFNLPRDMAKGKWDVYLGLTNPLVKAIDKDNPAYSVSFANSGMWNPRLGLNKIGTIEIDGATELNGLGGLRQITP